MKKDLFLKKTLSVIFMTGLIGSGLPAWGMDLEFGNGDRGSPTCHGNKYLDEEFNKILFNIDEASAFIAEASAFISLDEELDEEFNKILSNMSVFIEKESEKKCLSSIEKHEAKLIARARSDENSPLSNQSSCQHQISQVQLAEKAPQSFVRKHRFSIALGLMGTGVVVVAVPLIYCVVVPAIQRYLSTHAEDTPEEWNTTTNWSTTTPYGLDGELSHTSGVSQWAKELLQENTTSVWKAVTEFFSFTTSERTTAALTDSVWKAVTDQFGQMVFEIGDKCYQTLQKQGLKGLTSPDCKPINDALFDLWQRNYSGYQIMNYLYGACQNGTNIWYSYNGITNLRYVLVKNLVWECSFD